MKKFLNKYLISKIVFCLFSKKLSPHPSILVLTPDTFRLRVCQHFQQKFRFELNLQPHKTQRKKTRDAVHKTIELLAIIGISCDILCMHFFCIYEPMRVQRNIYCY